MEELKPCPFCGGKAEQIEYFENWVKLYGVTCSKCNAKITTDVKGGAIEAWNTRVTTEVKKETKMVRHVMFI